MCEGCCVVFVTKKEKRHCAVCEGCCVVFVTKKEKRKDAPR